MGSPLPTSAPGLNGLPVGLPGLSLCRRAHTGQAVRVQLCMKLAPLRDVSAHRAICHVPKLGRPCPRIPLPPLLTDSRRRRRGGAVYK
jgi:hypothetical protein